MADVVEVLQHWVAGKSIRDLASSLGMGRVRIRQIVAEGKAAGLIPGAALSREEIVERMAPRYAKRLQGRTKHRERFERWHEEIVAGLGANKIRTVWQRLRDEQGLGEARVRFVAMCATT